MYKTPQQRAAAVQNARNWVNTRQPYEAAYLNELITAESNWEPDVDSGTGATGLGQFIRGTWKDTANFARNNIAESDLPPGISYETLGDYDTMAKRPLASAFMSWANAKRIENTALKTVNSKRVRAGLPDATNLIEAFDNDPRKWATVVAAGHKDGASRTAWFVGDQGEFSTATARANYRERYDRFQSEAEALSKEARSAEAAGQNAKATQLFRQAQRKKNNDSTGHVFGYADRIASNVAGDLGLGPLEYQPEELDDFLALARPSDTDQNPARRTFLDRIESGVGLAAPVAPDGTQLASATEGGPGQEQSPRSLGEAILDAIIPAANAANNGPALRPREPIEGAGAPDLSLVPDTVATRASRAAQTGEPTQLTDPTPAGAGTGTGGPPQGEPRRDPVAILRQLDPRPEIARAEPSVSEGQPFPGLTPSIAGVSLDAIGANPFLAGLTRPSVDTVQNGGLPIPGQLANAPSFIEPQLLPGAIQEAQFNERAAEIQRATDAQAQQQVDQDAALLGLSLNPSISLTGSDAAIRAIAPQADPFNSLGVQPVDFSGLTSPLGVQPTGIDNLSGLARLNDNIQNGRYQASAQNNVLNQIANGNPVEGAFINEAQISGLDPTMQLADAQRLQEIGRSGQLDRASNNAVLQALPLFESPEFQRLNRNDTGLRQQMNKLVADYQSQRELRNMVGSFR